LVSPVELVFFPFSSIVAVAFFFFSGCYSSYLVYFCRGVFGFFVVEIMVVKPETSLVNAPMTYVKNGKNYSYWARSVEVFFKGKGWFPHLTSCNPEGIAPSLWEHEDNQIISFILNSIESHIGSSCIYLPIANYSGVGNITRIYKVCKQYFGLEQGAQSVDEYYN
jgi:hypothetical protein